MEEIVDLLVEKVEKDLTHNGIELEMSEIDEIRDLLDTILEKYSKE